MVLCTRQHPRGADGSEGNDTQRAGQWDLAVRRCPLHASLQATPFLAETEPAFKCLSPRKSRKPEAAEILPHSTRAAVLEG